jgi:hypothetical protein
MGRFGWRRRVPLLCHRIMWGCAARIKAKDEEGPHFKSSEQPALLEQVACYEVVVEQVGQPSRISPAQSARTMLPAPLEAAQHGAPATSYCIAASQQAAEPESAPAEITQERITGDGWLQEVRLRERRSRHWTTVSPSAPNPDRRSQQRLRQSH